MPETDQLQGKAGAIRNDPGLRGRVWLTWAGMLSERAARHLWPVWCAVMATYVVWKTAPLAGTEVSAFAWYVPAAAALVLLLHGLLRLRMPGFDDAIRRIDSKTAFRPLSALADRQATGLGDHGARALWDGHLQRMAAEAANARAEGPDLRLAASDRWSLRYILATAFVMAFVFVDGPAPAAGPDGEDAAGSRFAQETESPSFDAWVEPPVYTGEPGIYLNDTAEGVRVSVPAGSTLSVRVYGDADQLTASSTVSESQESDGAHWQWPVERDGFLTMDSAEGEIFQREFAIIPDNPPSIEVISGVEAEPFGRTRVGFRMTDDYGVAKASLVIELDLEGVDRIHGLLPEPEQLSTGPFRINIPFGATRRSLETEFIGDFGNHPWAGLPVRFIARVSDVAGQSTAIEIPVPSMPGRVLFDRVAQSVAEQRRDVIWSDDNSRRVARLLRSLTYQPEELFKSPSHYLTTRVALGMMVSGIGDGPPNEQRNAVAELLWKTALAIEEGDLASLRAMLTDVAERLAEAIRRGASEDELARLQDEYRRALEQFLAELARQPQAGFEDDNSGAGRFTNLRELDQSDIEQVMEELARMLAEGRIEEARRLLDQLRRMTENLVAARPGGRNSGGQFSRSMQGLGGTLQRQQGLADEAFRLQQERRMQEGAGLAEGNVGSSGGLGRGQDHFGDGSGSSGSGGAGDVAERQERLRQDLRQQMRDLANRGIENRQAMDSLEQAARAMTRARDQLRSNELDEALREQTEAIRQLGAGIRSLGQQFARESEDGYGGPPGTGFVDTDPLGRRRGSGGIDLWGVQVPEEFTRRRSQEIRQEIRRRIGESDRAEPEIDYLRRLLTQH